MKRREFFDAATKKLRISYEFEHPRHPGRAVHSRAMFELMGLPGAHKWPDAGLVPREVQGVVVWVESIRWDGGLKLKRPKSSVHRARCICPGCGRYLSAGRLHQHVCGWVKAGS